MLMWAKILFGAFILSVVGAPVNANECMPNYIKFDVCAAAREYQQKISPSLPMRLNSEMTLQSIAAVGPIFMFVVVWDRTDTQIQEMIVQSGTTRGELISRMDQRTESMVCGQEVTAAFVRLGGKIRYSYSTSDGIPVHTPEISSCP